MDNKNNKMQFTNILYVYLYHSLLVCFYYHLFLIGKSYILNM